MHSKPSGANLSRYSKRTNLGTSVPLLSHHLGTVNEEIFGVVSPSWPSVRPNLSASRATVSKKSGSFPISAVTLGGIIAAGVTVVLLLLLPFYLRHRRRKRRSKKAGDLENRKILLASHERGGHGSSSAKHSNDIPRSNLKYPLSISQPYNAAGPVSLPTLPISQMSDGKNGRAHPLSRPPPLLLPPALRPGREARRGVSFTVARSRTTELMGSSNRGSFLPNPWDSGAKPSPAAFERVIFGLPSAPAVRAANSFRAGLPRTPREPRTFLPPESRPPSSVYGGCK